MKKNKQILLTNIFIIINIPIVIAISERRIMGSFVIRTMVSISTRNIPWISFIIIFMSPLPGIIASTANPLVEIKQRSTSFKNFNGTI